MQSLIHAWMIGYIPHQTVYPVTYPCLDDWLHPTSNSVSSHLSMPGWLVTHHIKQWMQSLIHAWMIGYTSHQTVDAVMNPCLDDWLHPTSISGCSHLSMPGWLVTPLIKQWMQSLIHAWMIGFKFDLHLLSIIQQMIWKPGRRQALKETKLNDAWMNYLPRQIRQFSW